MSSVVSFFASGPQGQQGRAGLLTLRRGSRCERAQHGPRSAHPSPTPGATVRRTSLAALAPRAGVSPPWGAHPTPRPLGQTDPGPTLWSSLPAGRRTGEALADFTQPVAAFFWPFVRCVAQADALVFCEGWRVEGAQTEVPPLRGGNLSRGSDPQCEEGWRHDGSTPQPAGTTPAYAVPALVREGIGTVQYA